MTTKEQERRALAQITQIIESLGKGSYLSTAFNGCLEDAAMNIEDDAAYSMKDRWTTATAKTTELADKLEDVKAENAELTVRVQDAEERAMDSELALSIVRYISDQEVEITEKASIFGKALLSMVGEKPTTDADFTFTADQLTKCKRTLARLSTLREQVSGYIR